MSTGKSRFEGTEEIFLSEKTHTNKITGFIPLPLFLFTVEGQGKKVDIAQFIYRRQDK